MIRTQSISVLMFDTERPRVWKDFLVSRDHAFGEATHVAKSHSLICPCCQKTWAVLRFLDEHEVWPVAQFCELCIPERDDYKWHPVPGSILVEEGYGVIDESLLAALPPELVKREFELHLEAYKS